MQATAWGFFVCRGPQPFIIKKKIDLSNIELSASGFLLATFSNTVCLCANTGESTDTLGGAQKYNPA